MKVGSRLLSLLWLAWAVVCMASFVLEVESPFYAHGISWVYWGPETDVGWRESSLVRWGCYHLALIAIPPLACAAVRWLGRASASG